MLYIENLKSISLQDLEANFPKVYDAINSYYCMVDAFGNTKFIEYDDNDNLKSIIKREVKNRGNLKSIWENTIVNTISKKLNLPYRQTTFGIFPSYGFILELPKSNISKCEVYVQLSLLSQFYSIRIAFINPNMSFKNHEYLEKGYGIEKLIVSPEKGYYYEIFEFINHKIQKHFKGASFIPYQLELLKLKGLSTYENLQETPLGMAFFHPIMPINYYNPEIIIGNLDYGANNL